MYYFLEIEEICHIFRVQTDSIELLFHQIGHIKKNFFFQFCLV